MALCGRFGTGKRLQSRLPRRMVQPTHSLEAERLGTAL